MMLLGVGRVKGFSQVPDRGRLVRGDLRMSKFIGTEPELVLTKPLPRGIYQGESKCKGNV